MKILLTSLFMLFLAVPAQAETIHPPSWSESGNNKMVSNNKDTGNPEVAGNRIYTPDEQKARREAARNGSSSSILSLNSNTVKNTTDKAERNLKRKYGNRTLNSVWSELNN